MTVKAILKRAIARLEKGWTRGMFKRRVDGRYCYCAVGAIGRHSVGCERKEEYDAAYAVCDTLGISKNTFVLANWNDSQKRKRPVVSAFKKTLRRLEKEAA
jgi:hypothetical protein